MYYKCPKCGTHIGFYADYTSPKPDEDIPGIAMGESIADTFDKLQALEKRLRGLIKEVEEKPSKKNKSDTLQKLIRFLTYLVESENIDLMINTERFKKEVDNILKDVLD